MPALLLAMLTGLSRFPVEEAADGVWCGCRCCERAGTCFMPQMTNRGSSPGVEVTVISCARSGLDVTEVPDRSEAIEASDVEDMPL